MSTRPAILALALAACGASSPRTLRYETYLSGRLAGSHTVSIAAGERRIASQIQDRGRGGRTVTRMRLDGAARPVELEVSGTSYYNHAVAERFAIHDGVARWKNRGETGEARVSGESEPPFYVPADGDAIVELARAALRAPDHELPLLPQGRVRVERQLERRVARGGETQTVTLYAVTGLDFTPSWIWLDADGELFAGLSEIGGTVRAGWREVMPELQAAQVAAEEERLAALGRAVSRRPAALVVRGARVFDAEARRLRDGLAVLVENGRIRWVGPEAELRAPPSAEILDGAGQTLVPGLWDMHVHIAAADGLLDIASGVTTARDMGNDLDVVVGLRRRFADGTLVGPRLFLAGIIDGPGEYRAPAGLVVDDEAAARAAVDRLAGAGFEQVKIYSSLRPDLVAPIAREAHARGLRVTGHIPAGMTATQAVEAGYDELVHCYFLALNFMPDVKETRTPLRFTEPGRRAADLDLEDPRVKSFIALLLERHIVLDPTLARCESVFADRPGRLSAMGAPVADRVPPQVRRSFLLGEGLPAPGELDERYRRSLAKMIALTGAAAAAGVLVVAGTDHLPGIALVRELELHVAANIPPSEVLYMATLGAARVMRHDHELGSIEAGKQADLVLVKGNPLADIGALREVTAVVKDGIVYDLPALRAALGMRDPQ